MPPDQNDDEVIPLEAAPEGSEAPQAADEEVLPLEPAPEGESADEETVPVEPAPEPAAAPPPPPPPTPDPADDDAPIALEEIEETDKPTRRAIGAHARQLTAVKEEFQRGLNVDGHGATRCRLFYSKIAIDPLRNLETRINDWADGDEIEIKHVGHLIGTMEGKRPEPNLIVIVWY